MATSLSLSDFRARVSEAQNGGATLLQGHGVNLPGMYLLSIECLILLVQPTVLQNAYLLYILYHRHLQTAK